MNGAFATGNEPFVLNGAVLTRSFRIELPPRLQRDAAILAFAIECADRLLDGIRKVARRTAFGAAVASELAWRGFFNPDVTPQLARWLAVLREVQSVMRFIRNSAQSFAIC